MRVLIVEDEPKVAAAIKRGLEQDRFVADMVHDGESGLSYGLSDDYDAIILDRMLPGGMDGLDICKQLRNEGVNTPVLMLTAKDRIPDRVAGLDNGADDYLVKPFDFDELTARLRALLRRPRQSHTPVLAWEDLSLDPSSGQATRGTKQITLTKREYSLLEYLLRHANQVISKDTLLQHVWNDDADVLPNTIEVYMGYLRTKVDKPFKKPLLHTVRGFGYKLGDNA